MPWLQNPKFKMATKMASCATARINYVTILVTKLTRIMTLISMMRFF